MILFENDFAQQGAIIDYTTRNTSFLRTSTIIRQMGVKNNKFMLALYQKDLQGIDPHNLKDPSPELRLKIAYECKINYWYFIREVVKIPIPGTDEPGYYVLNRANLALSWVFQNNIATFLTMPRQIGKTIAVIVLIDHIVYICGVKTTIGLFAKGTNLVHENVDRIKCIRDNLPKYLVSKHGKDTDNKEGIYYHQLKNNYKTFIAQADTRSAQAQGRGESFILEHWDEIAYYTNNHLSYSSAISATDTVQPLAQEQGLRCANIHTTTAGWINNPAGEYAHSMKNGSLRFTEQFYDCEDEKQLKNILDSNSTNNMFYLEYSYKQLGKDDAWFKRVTAGKTPEEIATDYLNKWISGSGAPIFAKEILDRLDACRAEPLYCTLFESLVIRWYRPKSVVESSAFKNTPIIIGCDTSDNVGRDFTTFVGIDPSDLSVLFTAKCNVTNLTYVAQCIVKLLEDFPRSIFIPERNKNGAFLIDIILVTLKSKNTKINPFTRIYNTVIQEYNFNEPNAINIHNVDPTNNVVRKHFGFTTTRSDTSRNMLYKTVLTNAVHKSADRICDCDIIDEIVGLVVRNGRIDHALNANDDVLIAWLLSCYFVMFGKNLSMYGIDLREFLSCVDAQGKTIDPLEKERQLKYRLKIRDLTDRIEDYSVPEAIRREYITELKHLKLLLKDGVIDENIISITQVEESARKENKRTEDYSMDECQQLMSVYL